MSIESIILFSQVQPVCCDIVKKENADNLRKLEDIIDNKITNNTNKHLLVTCKDLNDIKRYISVSLIKLLNKYPCSPERQSILENTVRCLKKILLCSYDIEWNLFSDAFCFLLLHLSDKDNPNKVSKITEECKMEIICSITALCNSLSLEGITQFCSESFRPQLGHGILFLLHMAENEKSRNLKIAAFEAVMSLGLKSHNLCGKYKTNASVAYANFLPGISIISTKVATNGEIQGHKVSVVALECWSYFICLVLNDEFLMTFDEDLGISQTKRNLQAKLFPAAAKESTELEDVSKKVDQSVRISWINIDSKWISSTVEKIEILLKSLHSLVSHSHWRVRMQLVYCSQIVLKSCKKSLTRGTPILIDILMALTNDRDVDVKQEAERSLKFYQEQLSECEKNEFLKIVEERMFFIICRLPTIVKRKDDLNTLSTLDLLICSLSLVHGKDEEFFVVPIHVQRIIRSLAVILMYNLDDSEYLQERALTDDPLEIRLSNPRFGQNFRYISHSVSDRVFTLCNELGKQSNISLLVDTCLDLFQETSVHRKEVLLILCCIIAGATKEQSKCLMKEREMIVDSIFGHLFDHNIFDLSLKTCHCESSSNETSALVTIPSRQSLSVEMAKSNIVTTSNALRLSSICLCFVGSECRKYFSSIMCPLLEKAGDCNVLVAYNASFALEQIAVCCGYDKKVNKLIEEAIPHFWFGLSQKLKHLSEYPYAPQVLRFVLRQNKNNVSSFVEDLVDDVLDSLDSFHDESLLPLLTVLLAFVDSLLLLESSNPVSVSSTFQKESGESEKKESLVDFLLELENNERILSQEIEEEENLTDDNLISPENEDEPPVDEEPRVPRRIEVVVAILERCSYLLFYKDRKVQLVILQIVEIGCHLLNKFENQKLPIFHKLWKPLVLRLKDRDFVVLLKALETCVLMVNLSGDFLRKRCLKELFPSLSFFLDSQSSSSINKPERSGYYLTPAYKAQKHTLDQLPILVKGLDLGVLETVEVMQTLILYLDVRQPKYFTALAMKTVRVLYSKYPDLVWLSLSTCKDRHRIPAPSCNLKEIKISGKKRDFLDVDSILASLELQRSCTS